MLRKQSGHQIKGSNNQALCIFCTFFQSSLNSYIIQTYCLFAGIAVTKTFHSFLPNFSFDTTKAEEWEYTGMMTGCAEDADTSILPSGRPATQMLPCVMQRGNQEGALHMFV